MTLKSPFFISIFMLFFSLSCLPVLAEEPRTLLWDELLPADDLKALLNPPEYLDEIDDGSFEDQVSNGLQQALSLAGNDAYQQALVSTKVMPELDGQKVRVPGFLVPLTYDAEQRVTSFFIVPYFGACIHVPPPPPNQIIHAQFEKGSAVADIYDAYWVTGILHTAITQNDTATSAYSLTVTELKLYEDEPNQ